MTVINVIGGAISFFLAVLSGDWKGAWNAIMQTTREVLGNMVGIFGGMWGMIRGIVGAAWEGIKAQAAGGVDFLLSIPGRLWGLAGGLADVFANAGRAAINGMIGIVESGINGVIGGLDRLPGVDIGRVHFPRFATGGIVTQPTFGLIGEAGPEAIIPLSKLGSMNMGGGSSTYNITVSVGAGANPVDAGRAVVDAIKAYERSNGSSWRGAA
jgi:hypothetical protein